MKYKDKLIDWKQRRFQIYEENKNGLSYNQLAKKYDITVQRVYMLIRKVRNEIQKQES